MGLLFSILVACVGVVGFIKIYRNLARNLNENYERPNLTPDNRTCVKYANKECATSGETSASDISVPHIRLCREFLSHEDIEVECTADVLHSKSKSPSPRRLLVTEKEKDTSRSPSPRRFVVSEAHDRGLTTNLPEFLITEGILKDRTATDTKRFTLVDTKRPSRENSPLPLPEQFVVIQDDSNTTLDSLKPIKKVIDIKLTSLNIQRASDGTTVSRNLPTGNESQLIQTLPESVRKSLKEVQNLESSAVRINKVSATNDYTDDYILPQSGDFETSRSSYSEDVLGAFSRQDSSNKPLLRDEFPATGTEEFHRSPSPYPSLEITTKRPSVSADVLNSSSISVLEVDEDLYRSRSNSSEKIDVILESSNYNTTQYWTNKILVTPPRKSKPQHRPTTSISERSDGTQQRSKSATQHENDDGKNDIKKASSSYQLDRNESSSFEEYIQENLDSNDGQNENFLKSLDGISSKKQSRCTEGRRSFKKKKQVQSLPILVEDIISRRRGLAPNCFVLKYPQFQSDAFKMYYHDGKGDVPIAILINSVIDLFKNHLELDISISDLNNVYAIGKNHAKPIVVEFVSHIKKITVLKAANKLKGLKIFINHDLTVEEQKANRLLRQQLKLAKSEDPKAYIRKNKLYSKGEVYTADDFTNEEESIVTLLESGTKASSAPPTPISSKTFITGNVETKLISSGNKTGKVLINPIELEPQKKTLRSNSSSSSKTKEINPKSSNKMNQLDQ